MNIGIFIGRMQPIHIGHKKVIFESIKNNDLSLIILGSSGLIDDNNPYSDIEREMFLKLILKEKKDYKVLFLNDENTDIKWINSLIQLINNNVELSEKNRITFYGGDFKNDYAIRAIKEYLNLFNYGYIKFQEIPRKSVYFRLNGNNEYVSSTKIRSELVKGEENLLKYMIDPDVFNLINIKGIKK